MVRFVPSSCQYSATSFHPRDYEDSIPCVHASLHRGFPTAQTCPREHSVLCLWSILSGMCSQNGTLLFPTPWTNRKMLLRSCQLSQRRQSSSLSWGKAQCPGGQNAENTLDTVSTRDERSRKGSLGPGQRDVQGS